MGLTNKERQRRWRDRLKARAAGTDQAEEIARLQARVAALEAAQTEPERDNILAIRLVAIAREQEPIRRSLDREILAAMRASLSPTGPARKAVEAWLAGLDATPKATPDKVVVAVKRLPKPKTASRSRISILMPEDR